MWGEQGRAGVAQVGCDLLSDRMSGGISASGTASQEFDGIRRKCPACARGRKKYGAKAEG